MATLRFISYNGIETENDIIPSEIINDYSNLNIDVEYFVGGGYMAIGLFLTNFCASFLNCKCDDTKQEIIYLGYSNHRGEDFINLFNGDIVVSFEYDGTICYATIPPGYGTNKYCECYPYNNLISLTCKYENLPQNSEIINVSGNINSLKGFSRISINDGDLVMNVNYSGGQASIYDVVKPKDSNKIKKVEFEYSIDNYEPESIADNMFAGINVSEVNFPRFITKIGEGAFSNCTELINYYPSEYMGQTNYEMCTNLYEYGDYCFSGCSKLEEVHFKSYNDYNTGLVIGECSFYACAGLKEISFPSSIASLGYDNVTSIGNSAFTNCSSLEVIKHFKGGNLGSHIFSNCTALERIEYSEAYDIPPYCFENCSNLTTSGFTISSCNEYCFKNAFDDSVAQLEFTVRGTVCDLYNNFIDGINGSVNKITFNGNTNVNSSAFTDSSSILNNLEIIFYNNNGKICTFNANAFNNSRVETIKINSGNYSIFDNYAFSGASKLKYIYLTYLDNLSTQIHQASDLDGKLSVDNNSFDGITATQTPTLYVNSGIKQYVIDWINSKSSGAVPNKIKVESV